MIYIFKDKNPVSGIDIAGTCLFAMTIIVLLVDTQARFSLCRSTML